MRGRGREGMGRRGMVGKGGRGVGRGRRVKEDYADKICFIFLLSDSEDVLKVAVI